MMPTQTSRLIALLGAPAPQTPQLTAPALKTPGGGSGGGSPPTGRSAIREPPRNKAGGLVGGSLPGSEETKESPQVAQATARTRVTMSWTYRTLRTFGLPTPRMMAEATG